MRAAADDNLVSEVRSLFHAFRMFHRVSGVSSVSRNVLPDFGTKHAPFLRAVIFSRVLIQYKKNSAHFRCRPTIGVNRTGKRFNAAWHAYCEQVT